MWRLRRQIGEIGGSFASALVRGEAGVGKNQVVGAIHAATPMRRGPLVVIDCATPRHGLEEDGRFDCALAAPVGAEPPSVGQPCIDQPCVNQDCAGRFDAALNGTIALVDVQSLPPEAQTCLLRVIRQRRMRSIESPTANETATRIVTVTHRDLRREVDEGRLCADLLAEIEASVIDVPPLRDRWTDVPQLFAHFLREAAGDDRPEWWRDATDAPAPIPLSLWLEMLGYHWPTNVRQMRDFARTIAADRSAPARLPPGDGWPTIQSAPSSPAPVAPPPGVGRPSKPSRPELARILASHGYVKRRVAIALHVSRNTLDAWMDELGLRSARDLTTEEIEAARRIADGDVDLAARALGVSTRALRLRIRALRPVR